MLALPSAVQEVIVSCAPLCSNRVFAYVTVLIAGAIFAGTTHGHGGVTSAEHKRRAAFPARSSCPHPRPVVDREREHSMILTLHR
jgi:hypothetical protein